MIFLVDISNCSLFKGSFVADCSARFLWPYFDDFVGVFSKGRRQQKVFQKKLMQRRRTKKQKAERRSAAKPKQSILLFGELFKLDMGKTSKINLTDRPI